MNLTKKTVSGVTAKLAKVAGDLRAIQAEAEQEEAAAKAKAIVAGMEKETAAKIATNIETLLGL